MTASAVTHTQPRLNDMHYAIMRRLYKGDAVTPAYLCEGSQGFRIGRGRTVYNTHLLDDLRFHGLIDQENLITGNGMIWMLVEGVL